MVFCNFQGSDLPCESDEEEVMYLRMSRALKPQCKSTVAHKKQ
jgi:hypothetical protein